MREQLLSGMRVLMSPGRRTGGLQGNEFCQRAVNAQCKLAKSPSQAALTRPKQPDRARRWNVHLNLN